MKDSEMKKRMLYSTKVSWVKGGERRDTLCNHMKKRMVHLMMMIIATWIVLLPESIAAKPYTIDTTFVDMQLQTNGEVHVREQMTYTVKENADGVLWRYPKIEDATFHSLKAWEGKKEIPMKQSENDTSLYSIETPIERGKTAIVEVTYVLEDMMKKYEDGALFSIDLLGVEHSITDTDSLTVKVTPPEETPFTDAYGEGHAFRTEHVDKVGVTTFHLGRLPTETKSTFTVIADGDIFPLMKTYDGKVRPDIEKKRKEVSENEKQREATKKKWRTAAYIGLPLGLFALTFLIQQARKKERRLRQKVVNDVEKEGILIPKDRLSMAATLFYMNGRRLTKRVLTVGWIDLYRRRHLMYEDGSWTVRESEAMTRFDRAIAQFLLEHVQKEEETITFESIERTITDPANERVIRPLIAEMIVALEEEEMFATFGTPNKVLRRLFGSLSILLLLSMIFLFTQSLLLLSLLALVLGTISGAFAIFYVPKNEEGERFFTEWKLFEKETPETLQNDSRWLNAPESDRFRGLLYLYGMSTNETCEEGSVEDHLNTYIPFDAFVVHTYWSSPIHEIAKKMTKRKKKNE